MSGDRISRDRIITPGRRLRGVPSSTSQSCRRPAQSHHALAARDLRGLPRSGGRGRAAAERRSDRRACGPLAPVDLLPLLRSRRRSTTRSSRRGCAAAARLLKDDPTRAGPVGERVGQLADVRAKFLEATTPFRRAMTAQALVGPAREHALRVGRETCSRAQREEIAGSLRGRATGTRARRSRWRSARRSRLPRALSTWEYLRFSRGLSMSRARGVVERSLMALLRDAGVEVS